MGLINKRARKNRKQRSKHGRFKNFESLDKF